LVRSQGTIIENGLSQLQQSSVDLVHNGAALVDQGTALADQVSAMLNNILTAMDCEKYRGDEQQLGKKTPSHRLSICVLILMIVYYSGI
jgi:hypothetical protein